MSTQSTLFGGLEIRGLSLTRPWPFAFTAQPAREGFPPKRIENRSRRPPAAHVGHLLALHAAKSFSADDRGFIAYVTGGLYVPNRQEAPHSRIFAVCRLTGFVESPDDPELDRAQRPWYIGPYAWLLDELVELPQPVECKGALGLWRLSWDVEAEVRRQLAESTAAKAAPVSA